MTKTWNNDSIIRAIDNKLGSRNTRGSLIEQNDEGFLKEAGLTERQREILMARLEPQTLEEVATQFGITKEGVNSKVSAACRRLNLFMSGKEMR